MSKHTPGRWKVHAPTETDSRLLVLHPDGERVIAVCSEGFDSPSAVPIPEQERKANAALIASAPELLEAMHHAIAALDDAQRLHQNWIYADAQNAARAAIAKAEGRTP